VSDVFGSLVKQYTLRQTVAQADWLIGADILVPPASGFAQGLRSMKAPGTAYDTPEMGKDPQPDHMSRYVHLPNTPRGDNGGVHINSGIPNKAFYLTAATVGGFAWDAPGHIWYEALKASDSKAQFQDFADTTFAKAGQLYGNGGLEQRAVQGAWRDVGIRITGTAVGAGRGGPAAAARPTREEDSLAALARQIELLSQQIQALTKEVSLMKSRK
jgi:Zn-dependent metalloprotease